MKNTLTPEQAAKRAERLRIREEKRLAAIAKREAKAAKKAEKAAKQAEKEAKRNAFSKMVAEQIGKRSSKKPEFTLAQQNEIKDIIDRVLQRKVFNPIKKAQDVNSISTDGKIYRKFTCDELMKIFGGWFTLKYLFSVQSETVKNPLTDKLIETDFYCCSQDVSGMNVNERPPLNEALHKQFGVDVYGFCIIAPSTVF